MRVPISGQLGQPGQPIFVIICLLDYSYPRECEVILICISQMANDLEHLLMVLAIYIFEEMSLQTIFTILTRLFVFFCIVAKIFYTFW